MLLITKKIPQFNDGNRTEWCPNRSVIIRVINKIGWPLSGSLICLMKIMISDSLRKQLIFGDTTTGFPAKWRLINERWNSILMTRHYPDPGSASDWLNQISHTARPIRSTTQGSDASSVWTFYPRFSDSFDRETSGSVAKCRLFSEARFQTELDNTKFWYQWIATVTKFVIF